MKNVLGNVSVDDCGTWAILKTQPFFIEKLRERFTTAAIMLFMKNAKARLPVLFFLHKTRKDCLGNTFSRFSGAGIKR